MAPLPARTRDDRAPDSRGELLVRVGGGDPVAFEQLYDEVAHVVYGLVLQVLGDPQGAESVVREVFLDVWRTASAFEPELASASGWIMALAHRQAADRARSGTVTTSGADAGSTATGARSPATRHALDRLPAAHRQALELAYFGAHTHQDVSRVMDVSSDIATTSIRTALFSLGRHLVPTGMDAAT